MESLSKSGSLRLAPLPGLLSRDLAKMRSNQAGVKAPFISAPASAAKIAARKLERPDEWGNRLMREHAQAALDKREEKDWDRERAKWLADLLAPVRAERLEKAKTAIADLFKELKKNPQFTIPYDLWLGLEAYHGNRDAKIVHRAATQPARELEAMRKAIRLQNAVGNRLKEGFVYKGGLVGGNFNYVRGPFVQKGLISNEHPLLALFVEKLPRRGRIMAGEDKEYMRSHRSKLLGGDLPYVEDNKTVTGVVRIELDMVVTQPEIEELCTTAGVPLPNIIVGYENGCGGIVNPHLMWLLHDSVPIVGEKNERFLGKYRRVLRGLVKAFLPLGADPGGMLNSHRHKNPLSPLWDIRILAELPYELADIGAAVDTKIRQADLKAQFAAMHAGKVQVPDHPDVDVAVGSNRLFSNLADWARERVVDLRAAGWSQAEFSDAVGDEASRLAAIIAGGRTDKTEKRAAKVARKVATWTWTQYKPPAAPRAKRTKDQVSAICSAAGRQGAENKRVGNERYIVDAALELASKLGRTPKKTEVLAEVRIRDPKTVRRHWPAVVAAIEKQGTRGPYVKRNEAYLACAYSSPSILPNEILLTGHPPAAIKPTLTPMPASLRRMTRIFGNAPVRPEPATCFEETIERCIASSVTPSPSTMASGSTNGQSISIRDLMGSPIAGSNIDGAPASDEVEPPEPIVCREEPIGSCIASSESSSPPATHLQSTNGQVVYEPYYQSTKSEPIDPFEIPGGTVPC